MHKSFPITRRAFVGSAALAALPPQAGSARKPAQERYRVVSWWLTADDVAWPNDELMDKIRRRADRCAASAVNCCLVFGVHFRWDFMPMWGRVHDLLRFIADELHERDIMLIDHHSSVLTHRARNREEALNISRRNRHHVPFYPTVAAAAEWKFEGRRLNDWRMLDVETGKPVYLPAYNAEQFCMNNAEFRQAYGKYVRQLVAETGIDGLMSDDGIFYAGWRACACEHCRGRFQKEYGRRLPPVADTSFWGNRGSEAFADWVEMRFRTAGDYLAEIKTALPERFPFLTCCSSSDGYTMPAVGMSYQDFIRSCNLVLLEMAGSTPSIKGTWDTRIPSQLLHLGIARDHRVPCLGLGYGFFPDTAFFVWALNKFLGSDSWFSTLKGRLNAGEAQLAALADDSELVEEGYRWEKEHPQLFTGDVDTDVAVFFSRATRDYYGQCAEDYVNDYYASCLELLRREIPYEVVTAIPHFGRIRRLVLSGVTCLSAEEQRSLARFLEAGGTVIATGPTGHHDERARPLAKGWLARFGIPAALEEPVRGGAFPPNSSLGKTPEVARCRVPDEFRTKMSGGWFRTAVGGGRLLWRPERITEEGMGAEVAREVTSPASAPPRIKGLPAAWRLRRYRDGKRMLIHAIPGEVETVLHATLRNHFTREPVIEKLRFPALQNALEVESGDYASVRLYSPDLAESRAAKPSGNGWTVEAAGVKRYFVIECHVQLQTG